MAQKFIELKNKKTLESALFQHFGYDYHKQLETEYKRKFGDDWLAIGGGWWYKDDKEKVIIYYSRSQAFGRFDEEIIQQLAEERAKEKNPGYKVFCYSGAYLDDALFFYNEDKNNI